MIPPSRSNGLGLPGALVILTLAAICQLLCAWGLDWLAPPPLLTPVWRAGWANLVGLSLAMGGALLLLKNRSGQSILSFLSFRLPTAGRGRLLVGVTLCAIGGSVLLGELGNLLAWLWPISVKLRQVFNQLTGDPQLLASLFSLSLVAPLTEECLFRGLLLPGLAARYGRGSALVLTSLLFALFHLNPWQAGGAFLAGLYLGALFVHTGTLVYPLLGHALFNGLPPCLAAVGWIVPGYNTPLTEVIVFQNPLQLVGGALVLAVGLGLSFSTRPPAPPGP